MTFLHDTVNDSNVSYRDRIAAAQALLRSPVPIDDSAESDAQTLVQGQITVNFTPEAIAASDARRKEEIRRQAGPPRDAREIAGAK